MESKGIGWLSKGSKQRLIRSSDHKVELVSGGSAATNLTLLIKKGFVWLTSGIHHHKNKRHRTLCLANDKRLAVSVSYVNFP